MAEPGFYPDPYDATLLREWDGEKWGELTRTGPDAVPVATMAAYVGQSYREPKSNAPTPPRATAADGANALVAVPTATTTTAPSGAALTVAILWTVVALIVGISFISGTEHEAYGGDAYTGIQNAGADTVRALGWLIIATGPLGLITALSRRR